MSRVIGRAGPVLAVAALILSGCYKYVPVETGAAPSGEEVRVLVTRQGAAEYSEVAALDGRIPELRGNVVGYEGSDLLLAVEVASPQVGFRSISLRQTVRIPTGEILSIDHRMLDKGLTAAVVGGVAAAGTAMMLMIIDASGRPPGPNPDPEFLVNLWSIPIG